MKVYSDILTHADIVRAVRSVPSVEFQDTFSREGWYVPLREFTPRKYQRGFEFFLSGSSPHRAQHNRSEYAATWTEWGIVIDALFRIDPDAKIGWYEGRAAFLRETDEALWHSASEKPWLYS